MSLIYPKHTSLASRLHCTPIPNIIIPEPDVEVDVIDVEAWTKRKKSDKKGEEDSKNSSTLSPLSSPNKGSGSGKNSSSSKSGSGSGSGNFSPMNSKDSSNSNTKNKEKGKEKEKGNKKEKRKPSAAGIGAGLLGGWKLSDEEDLFVVSSSSRLKHNSNTISLSFSSRMAIMPACNVPLLCFFSIIYSTQLLESLNHLGCSLLSSINLIKQLSSSHSYAHFFLPFLSSLPFFLSVVLCHK